MGKKNEIKERTTLMWRGRLSNTHIHTHTVSLSLLSYNGCKIEWINLWYPHTKPRWSDTKHTHIHTHTSLPFSGCVCLDQLGGWQYSSISKDVIMSVFERKREDKLITDDTKPLSCRITDARNTDGHIVSLYEWWNERWWWCDASVYMCDLGEVASFMWIFL